MHDTRYVIIPTNEITDEMRNSSDIEVPNTDRTGAIFEFRSCNKPSCFDEYTNYSPRELKVICQIDEPDNWGYSNPF
jgi:hypothetical protein